MTGNEGYWRPFVSQVFGPAVRDKTKPQELCVSCHNCMWFGGPEGSHTGPWGNNPIAMWTCGKATPPQMPPPDVMFYGCKEFEDKDEIPF